LKKRQPVANLAARQGFGSHAEKETQRLRTSVLRGSQKQNMWHCGWELSGKTGGLEPLSTNELEERRESHKYISALVSYGWTGQEPSSGFCDLLAPSILHYNWF
jgi:hypothetical protein